jgi:hypothetical protein
MSDQKQTKMNAEQIRLFTFNEIGAALNAGLVSDADASKVLLERARRKATQKSTPVRTAA